MEKILITDYQRLGSIELELKYGINLISGSSNNGKSSIIRAVRDFIFNKISKDKIRHGTNVTAIEIDGQKAYRDNKGTAYIVDGETLEKVGRVIVPEIKNKFNIDEFVINGVSIKPNFWFQMDKPFLMDKTAGQKNDLLLGSKNDKYLKALKSIKAEYLELGKVDKKSTEKVIDTLKSEILKKEKLLEKYNGIEELVDKIETFEKQYSEYEKIVNLMQSLKEEISRKKILKKKLENYNKLNYKHIYEIKNNYDNLKEKLNSVYSIYKKYKENDDQLNNYSNRNNCITELLNKGSVIKNSLDDYNLKLKTNTDLEKVFDEYNKAFKELNNIKDFLKFKEYDLDKKRKEFEEFKSKIKVCPLCGEKLKK